MRLTEAGLKLGMAAALGLAVATGAAAQSAQQQLASESVIETIKKRGALKVGMSTFIPWAMRDKTGRAGRLRDRRRDEGRGGHGGGRRVRPDGVGRDHPGICSPASST